MNKRAMARSLAAAGAALSMLFVSAGCSVYVENLPAGSLGDSEELVGEWSSVPGAAATGTLSISSGESGAIDVIFKIASGELTGTLDLRVVEGTKIAALRSDDSAWPGYGLLKYSVVGGAITEELRFWQGQVRDLL